MFFIKKQRSITFKTMDFYEDINKYAKNVLQPLPHTMPGKFNFLFFIIFFFF